MVAAAVAVLVPVATATTGVSGLVGGDRITTFAGASKFVFGGFSGDGGPATKARLSAPSGVAIDKQGNVYIADTGNQRVREVSMSGKITTIAGGGPGLSGGTGPATSAHLDHPTAVAVDAQDNVYVVDDSFVYRISPSGTLSTVAGSADPGFSGDGGPASAAELDSPEGIAVDDRGDLYIADTRNNRVREVMPAGTIKTIAGTGVAGFSGDGGPATAARLDRPAGVAVDAHGDVYIADRFNSRVRKVSPSGTITTVAGNGRNVLPVVDGKATATPLSNPFGVAVDAKGNLYISNGPNVYEVSPGGAIVTIAGLGPTQTSKGMGDGGPATSATLATSDATGLAFDRKGDLYIADCADAAVREIWSGTATKKKAKTSNASK
jgi:sugar lactone lactonase YvrE